VLRRIPMNKIGDISDVAGAVIYLASDAAKLVSGTCLLVRRRLDGSVTLAARERLRSRWDGSCRATQTAVVHA